MSRNTIINYDKRPFEWVYFYNKRERDHVHI